MKVLVFEYDGYNLRSKESKLMDRKKDTQIHR